MKLSEIGEFGLIDVIQNMAKHKFKGGIGDDCAVINIDNKKEIVVTTDTLVENVHFFSGTSAYSLGRKSLAVSVSDVAAMAAIPKWAFLSISLNDMQFDYIKSFMEGFYSLADEFNILLLGGDTTRSSVFSITVTLIGENGIGESVTRGGAQVGDYVYVTGNIGCSYTGLYAITHNLKGFDKLKTIHLNPYPRIKEALSIKPYVSAMIDVSDGLLQDCLHICEHSGVAIEIDFDKIPFCKTNIVEKEKMLSGGEDYELVFCASNKYDTVLQKISNIKRIGTVKNGFGVDVVKGNRKIEIKNLGFKHF